MEVIANTETEITENIKKLNKKGKKITPKDIIIEYLTIRPEFIGVINEKQVIYTIPLTPEELIIELNYHLKEKFTEENEIINYIDKIKSKEDKRELKYRWDKYVVDWKKVTTNSPSALSPSSADLNLSIRAELKFNETHSYKDYIKNENI